MCNCETIVWYYRTHHSLQCLRIVVNYKLYLENRGFTYSPPINWKLTMKAFHILFCSFLPNKPLQRWHLTNFGLAIEAPGAVDAQLSHRLQTVQGHRITFDAFGAHHPLRRWSPELGPFQKKGWPKIGGTLEPSKWWWYILILMILILMMILILIRFTFKK